MIEMLYATGMRVSELVQLPMNQVNLEAGYALIYGKGSKERVVPLGSEAIQWITLYLANGSGTSGKRKGEPSSLRWAVRKGNEPAAVLEEPQRLWSEGRNPEENDPPSSAPFLCQSSPGAGSRSSFGSDDAWPCRHLHHSDLYPCHRGAVEEGSSEVSSERLTALQ